MEKPLISPPNLELFLSRLNEEFGQYMVLRGYDYLPHSYKNDIDVYIPKADLAEFFSCVNNLEGLDTRLVILVSRLGLIKCELLLDNEIIPFDIMYGFYYAGLEYQDCLKLLNNCKKHPSNLFVTPDISDEIRISLLKELLHNGRVRHDKAPYLLKNMELCFEVLPTDFFDVDIIGDVRAAITNKDYYVPKISRAIKIKVLLYNLRKHSANTMKNIIMFFVIKWVLKNKYHNKIVQI